MVSQVQTVAFQGLDVRLVTVQVQIADGIPAFTIVGLPDKAIGESRERVRSALLAMGLSLPAKRITVNLSPADLQKEGNHYDLPIAIGLLESMGVLKKNRFEDVIALGELGLDGRLAPISGALPAAVEALSRNCSLICPHASGSEAAWAKGVDLIAPEHLLQLVNHYKGRQVLTPPKPKMQDHSTEVLDLKDVKGQESAKRALEVAAAGGHNVLMVGPPGAGKSMLAARMPSILPSLSPEEALEVTMVHSIAGHLKKGQLIRQRPFRSPHHSASLPALVGGGSRARPGDISLAHRGVLFLDELPEFSRHTLEALRQPLETGNVSISRANARYDYPASFQLISAMNPCRCGYAGDSERSCKRIPHCVQDYQNRLSGPLLDRIDLRFTVEALSPQELRRLRPAEPSKDVLKRVTQAREKQKTRFQAVSDKALRTNAQMQAKHIEVFISLDKEAEDLALKAAEKLRLSARAFHRVLKVSQTIADLGSETKVLKSHVAEALSYRQAG